MIDDDCDSGAIPLPATTNNSTTITTHLTHIITAIMLFIFIRIKL